MGAAALAAGCGGTPSPTGGDSSALDGRSPRVPASDPVRVLVELRRPSLGDAVARTKLSTHDVRAYVASLEKEVGALLGALRAKNVHLGQVVTYARVWHGFAATVRSRDLPAVQALGLRVEPVRRFYGAVGRVTAADSRGVNMADPQAGAGRRAPAIALLDSGVARGLPALRGRVRPGYDAVGGDGDPSPTGPGESHGTEIAGVLAAGLPKGERLISIRVAALQHDPVGGGEVEAGQTDQLLAGLEHAVDPNGNGDVSDAVPIALIGVSSPYAGFGDSPEAEAVRGAGELGTLTVAPAGNEGPTVGAFGTMGSPGAAPAALAVAALDGAGPALPGVELGLATARGRAELDGALLGGGGRRALRAPATPLAGPSQAAPRTGGRAAGGAPLEYLTVDARPKARGRVVVVPYRGVDGRSPSIAERAASAVAAGAVALVVCQPDSGRPLAALPPGGPALPVIGLTGDAARRALDLTGAPGGLAFVSAPERRHSGGSLHPGRWSSRGPTYTLAPKPDLAEPGTAETVAPTGGRVLATGTSVAAARAAIAALVLHRRAPTLRAPQLAAALVGTARPRGAPLAVGAGQPDPVAASHATAVAAVPRIAFPIEPPGRAWSAHAALPLSNPARVSATLQLSAASSSGVHLAFAPSRLRLAPGASATVAITASAGPRRSAFATGRMLVRGAGTTLALPVAIPIEFPPRPRLAGPTLLTRAGRVTGARFAVGSVHRTPAGIAVQAVQALTLSLIDPRGRSVRELTPAGGAPDVLPGEYSYTLPPGTARSLHGDYRFRVRVLGTAGGALTAESPRFTMR